jgi:hypothetical protein
MTFSFSGEAMGETLERFQIHVDDAVLEDLRRRLGWTRFPDQIAGTSWEYGIPMDYLRELVAYWRDTYDWRAQEARLNLRRHGAARAVRRGSANLLPHRALSGVMTVS